VMPNGIVLFSFRSGIAGLLMSRSHASRRVLVSVTRGGGLEIEGPVMRPKVCLFSRALTNKDDSVCRACLFLR